MTSTQKEPVLLKSNDLKKDDIGKLKWAPNRNSDYLYITNNGYSIEWKSASFFKRIFNKEMKPCWLPAPTLSQLHSGHYSWDFVIEEMSDAQIGIGFLLQWNIGPDWGFYGYLGSSNSAWSYDPSTGDIVLATKSINGGLPKIENRHCGVVSVELNLPRDSKGFAKFIVNGIDTPTIELPESSVVLPAACFLKEKQKVTLKNFKCL